MTERIKQKAAERKRQTEENLITRAAEPADSALERIMSPVDSAAARAGGKAGAAVARVARGPDPVSQEETQLREQLAAGRADLTGVAFDPGTDALNPASDPTLAALARVLASATEVFLLQGRADAGTSSADAQPLAELRAVALKNWLVGAGVPGERIFAAGDGAATPQGVLASVLRMQ